MSEIDEALEALESLYLEALGRECADGTAEIMIWMHTIRQALEQRRAPEGWQLVPVEPTEQMLANVVDEGGFPRIMEFTTPEERDKPFLLARYTYRAMLAAAPKPEADHE